MKRLTTTLAVLALATTLYAADTATDALSFTVVEAPTSKAQCPSECAKECTAGCPLEAAMAKLPKMTYKVATEATCCADAAAKLAKEHNAEIKFVVADKTFEAKGEAMAALAGATEQFVTEFTTTKECKVSGKFTVAGKELCCNVMAGERAELAKKAMKDVHMTYLVGDKACSCPNEAASLAKSTGTDKQFVVAGEKTCCDVTARLKLAQAKYKAAVQALAKVDAPKETAEKS